MNFPLLAGITKGRFSEVVVPQISLLLLFFALVYTLLCFYFVCRTSMYMILLRTMGRSLRASRRRQCTPQGSTSLTKSPHTHHPYTHSHGTSPSTTVPIVPHCMSSVVSGSLLPATLSPVLSSAPTQGMSDSIPNALPSPGTVVKVGNNSIRDNNTILNDSWSPFDTPAIRECLFSSIQSLPSLLERVEHNPLYRPSQSYATYGASTTVQDPTRFITSYSGHMYPSEQIIVRIVDLDSGEYLQRFPF